MPSSGPEVVCWDTCIFIHAVQKGIGSARAAKIWTFVEPMVQLCEAGRLKVVTSEMTRVELLRCDGLSKEEQHLLVSLLDREYVEPRAVDTWVARHAQSLRMLHADLGVVDAVEVATALRYRIPYLITTDGARQEPRKVKGLLEFDGKFVPPAPGALPLRIMSPEGFMTENTLFKP